MATASRRCMVYKCGKTSRDRSLSFHSFPKRKEIRDKWVINIKLGQPDWTVPKCSSSKYYAICSRHFERNCFRTVKHKFDVASRNTLKPDAVPSLYMSGGSDPTPLQSHTSNYTDRFLQAVNGLDKNSVQSDNHVPTSSETTGNQSLLHKLLQETVHNPSSSSSTFPVQINTDEPSPKRYPLASRRCMVLGCGSTSRDRSLSFHAFPKNLDFREEWLARIKLNRPNWSPNWPESNYYAVCSKHFTPDSFKTMKHNFCSTSRNTLRPDAVPSLYLANPQQRQNSEHALQKPPELQNGNQGSRVFHGGPDYLSLLQNEQENSWVSPSGEIADFEAENGDWSPTDSPFVDASTQTVEVSHTNGSLEPKQTRTVRVQTIITIKKFVQDQSTQYDIPTENGEKGEDDKVKKLSTVDSSRRVHTRSSSGSPQSASVAER